MRKCLLNNISRKIRIPLISGFHFWSGAILLSEETGNINILENSKKHKKNTTAQHTSFLTPII